MTPAHRLKTTRSLHSAQYHRHQTYNDALKNFPFPPELFHIGIVCLLLWPIPSSQRSLGHSLLKQKFSQKFFVLFLFCFWVVFVFYFIKISKSRNLWCNAQVWAKPVKIERKELKVEITMKNLLIMQENEFSGTISIYPSTMQPLCRPTHVDKLVTSNFQICFPAPYFSLHAKYSLCRTCPEAELAPVSPITVLL